MPKLPSYISKEVSNHLRPERHYPDIEIIDNETVSISKAMLKYVDLLPEIGQNNLISDKLNVISVLVRYALGVETKDIAEATGLSCGAVASYRRKYSDVLNQITLDEDIFGRSRLVRLAREQIGKKKTSRKDLLDWAKFEADLITDKPGEIDNSQHIHIEVKEGETIGERLKNLSNNLSQSSDR